MGGWRRDERDKGNVMRGMNVMKMVVGVVGVAAGVGFGQPAAKPVGSHPVGWMDEKYRPQYHFTPEINWMNDPNGLVYYGGEYHLFYQYNPMGDQWGHMSWGHAVSRDMLRWEHLPVAIPAAGGVMAFSGSAVVDWKNSSGFGKGGEPPLVAIYTGHREADGHQSQYLAASTDKGRTWTPYAGNPVIDVGSNNFRDPKVFWWGKGEPGTGDGNWVMVVAMSEERRVRFYTSADLKTWELRSAFGPAGATAGVWECPDLFELPVRGGQGAEKALNEEQTRAADRAGTRKWVLVVNISGGAPAGGNGGQYFVGTFDGKTFTPDAGGVGGADGKSVNTRWLDYGPDYYAAVTWSDIPASDGRRVMLGWMVNGQYAGAVPTRPWKSAMSLPRTLWLEQVGGRLGERAGEVKLFQMPVKEVESLRDRRFAITGGSVADVNRQLKEKHVEGELLEIAADFKVGDASKTAASTPGMFGLKVRGGTDGRGTMIGYDVGQMQLFVDRRKSGEIGFHPAFAQAHEASLEMRPGGEMRLHVWVDRSSVEVFAGGGELAMTQLIFPEKDDVGVEVWSEDGEVGVTKMEVWTLKSVWR